MLSPRATKRITLKVNRGGKKIIFPLCFIHPEIFETFLDVTHTRQTQMKKWIIKWAEEDFNWSIDFTEVSHITLLRELILDRCKRVYPHLYYNNSVTIQGWTRCWVSEKMSKEILRNDKARYNGLFNAAPNCGSRF